MSLDGKVAPMVTVCRARIREHFLGSATKSMRRCQNPAVTQVAMRIREHYEKKNRQASVRVNLSENCVRNPMDVEACMQSNPPSSSVTPNFSVNRQSVQDGSTSSKCTTVRNSMRDRQASLEESF